MNRFRLQTLLAILILSSNLFATQQNGSVRAADQYIPGATVTARWGGAKLTTFTDGTGHYSFDLAPGNWDISVEMFGFNAVHESVKVGEEPSVKDWVLEMPRAGEKLVTLPASEQPKLVAPEVKVTPPAGAAPAAAKTAEPEKAVAAGNPAARNRRPGAQPRPGVQNATVRATEEGEQALAQAAGAGASATAGDEAGEESFLVSGSTSGGLGASSDEEARRQKMMRGGGDRGGPGGGMDAMGGANMPPGMRSSDGDSMGLGGFGASALAAGFGGGQGGAPGGDFGGSSGGRGGSGGQGGGFSGGGGDRGSRGGGSSNRGSRGGPTTKRGPNNGQFSSFGNRYRAQPAYTGSVYMSLNNSALNAAPYSLNGQQAIKPSYAQNTFGASFGGPLVIPKLVNLERWSFYFTYSGTRSRNPFSRLSSVPTLAERNGDFSLAKNNAPVTIYDPLTQLPFAGNVIPVSRFSPASAGLLKFFPVPTYGGIVQNYQLVTSIPNTNDNFGVRLNAPLSRKDRLTFNMQMQRRASETQQLFGFRDSGDGSGTSYSLGWSHSFKPRLNNSANISLSRNISQSTPFFAYGDNIAASLGITGISQDPVNYGPPNLSFTNFGGLSDGGATLNRSQTISFTDNITYVIKKKHNLTMGFGYRRMQNNSLLYQNARGAFTFSGLLTSGIDANGQPIKGTGFDFADFLLGLPQSSSLRYGSDNNYFRGWSTNNFVQDDYRITRKLSFNVGLRYEYFSPFTELRGHLANLDLNAANTAVAVVTPGSQAPFSGDLPNSLIRNDPNNYSPRFGFAYRPTTKRGMVIRGGYSIFFSGSIYSQVASQMASQPPFATTVSISTSPAVPLTIQNGFPRIPAQTITNTYAIDPDYRIAYAQTWTFAVQNTLPHSLFLELEYIGTKGTDLSILTQPNQASPGSPLTAQQRLKIPNATGFSYQSAGANSSYNAGQVRLTRRFTRGMAGTALYMFSKAIDDASSYNGSGGTIVQFIDNLRLERGLSSFDQRHRLQTTYLLSSPVGIHGMLRNGGWKMQALTGWALSGTFSMTSGAPMTARVAGNLSNTGGVGAFGTGRAQATGQGIDDGNYPYFNLQAFTTPPAGQYGNAARNTIPGLFNIGTNMSLNRAFRFKESRRQLQLRLNASNALNHITITSIGTTVNSSTYGLPIGASSTRVVSLMMRFNF
jgi:hypothetical protein